MTKLAILGGLKTINIKGNHFLWPPISKESTKAIVKQLHESVSVYDKSGIIKLFEEKYANYQNRKYALSTNNGTSAIHSMFFGVGIEVNDEVICPAYTYYATASPLLFLGASPIFCDCDENGNIDPNKIERLISSKTKAVVVTHMWGIPAQIDKIKSICKKHNLLLLEDCSHTHGAKYKGKMIGSWGDAAAWSMQAHKTLSGGEAGVLATDNKDIYLKAMILGNNFMRCYQEIPKKHPLSKYSITGMGLKYRAHPLAVALATEQLSHLDSIIKQKQVFAKKIINELSRLPGIKTPSYGSNSEPSWYLMVMQYQSSELGGLSKSKFIKAVQAEGAVEFGQPDSPFCSLNTLPLFQNPKKIFNWYNGPTYSGDKNEFLNAFNFSKNAIKLPVWASKKDESIVNLYIKAITKVIKNYKDLL